MNAMAQQQIRWDYHITPDQSYTIAAGIILIGMTFVASSSYLARAVKMKIFKKGNPGNALMAIYSVDGNGRPQNLLASGVLDGNALSTNQSGAWIEVILVTPVNLTGTTEYALVLDAPNGDDPTDQEIGWRYDSAQGYVDGHGVYSGDDGGSWSDQGWDFMFEVWS